MAVKCLEEAQTETAALVGTETDSVGAGAESAAVEVGPAVARTDVDDLQESRG